MSKEILFEATVNGETISLMVTKKNDIMIEASDDGYISRNDIYDAASAKGFNCCFDTSSKERLLNPATLTTF